MILPALAQQLSAQKMQQWHARAVKRSTCADTLERSKSMNGKTKRILELVAAGKISATEGEKLLDALEAGQATEPPSDTGRKIPRFLRIQASAASADGKDEGFNLSVPLELVRAGFKLRSLIPKSKRDKINEKLRAKGVEADIFEISDKQIDVLISSLSEVKMEAGDSEGNLRIYLE
jgi:hypothetical protein